MDITALYQIFLGCTGITTDSRNCPEGSLFIALKGDTFNGNAFAAKALEAGSTYAVVDEAAYAPAGDTRYILVDNCLHTLQQACQLSPPPTGYAHHRHYRNQWENNDQGAYIRRIVPKVQCTVHTGKSE